MLRTAIFAATVLAAGCPKGTPAAPQTVDDRALRIRIAKLEVRRAAGIAELRELAATGDIGTRELALRALGRSGGPDAIATLEAALVDAEPRVVIAAASALGVRASLEEDAKLDATKLVPLLAHPVAAVRVAAAEALGRAGRADQQTSLHACAKTAPACALALGRFGRRKLALDDGSRTALVAATASNDRDLRYAATYALSREHEPSANGSVITALTARIADDNPETRATAIAGLAKRKAITAAARGAIERALRDADWRVATEAARALVGLDDTARTFVVTSLAGRPPHVVHEALRALTGKSREPAATAALTALANEPGWTGCLAARAIGGAGVVDAVSSCKLPDHHKLPLLADVDEPAQRRAALRLMIAHEDPRVRGAGLGVLAATWRDTEPRERGTIISMLTASLASKSAIVAGSAVEAAGALFAEPDFADPFRTSLAAALVARANEETDAELAASLFGVIEKHAIASGIDACRAGLSRNAVAAQAAAKCLRALGEVPPTGEPAVPDAPPVDIATVIGHTVTWRLATARGEITIALRPDVAPWAVASIAALSQKGAYDGLDLHRVVPGFVAQGGDPTMSGWGGPGYMLPAEPAAGVDGTGFVTGGIGIADAGPDSGGSQWFVMHAPAPHLDGRYTWVGSISAGQQVADSLTIGDKVERATVEIR